MKIIQPGKWSAEFDENGKMIRTVCDSTCLGLLGYERGEDCADLRLAWLDRIHPEDRARVDAHVSECMKKHADGLDYDIEYRIMTDRGYRWLHDYAVHTRREDGTPIRCDGVVFDIQDIIEKRENAELLKREEMIIADRNRILADITKAMFGYNVTVDPDTLECSVIRGTDCDGAVDIFERCETYEEVSREFDAHIPDPAAKERVRSLFSVESIRRIIAEGKRGYIGSVEYPVISANPGEAGKPAWRTTALYIGVDADGKAVANLIGRNSTEEHDREEAETRLRLAEETNRALDIANRHEKLRADALDFMSRNNCDIEEFVPFLSQRLIELYDCDQVIYCDREGRMIINDRPGTPKVDFSLCESCPHFAFDAPIYADGVTIMDDCRIGYKGLPVHEGCIVKSALTQIVHKDEEPFGYVAIHYLTGFHRFTNVEIESFDRIAKFFSLILDRMHSNERLVRALETAENANRAKTNFLFNMSHDIRTPLNAIMGFAEIASKNFDDVTILQECIDKTRASGALLLSIINSILDMSRIESGKTQLEETTCDMMLAFASVEPTMNTLACAKSITLSFGYGEITDRFVFCDLDKMNRVLVNIISNAIKYTPPSGRVEIRCDQIESVPATETEDHYGVYRFTISDNGIGMSEEFLAHAFEEFTRERNSTTSGIQGTGLGLALCKAFVDLMGGTIECSSKQGEGTTFTIDLPFRIQEHHGYIDPLTLTKLSVTQPIAPINDAELLGRRVLVVEDNVLNREVAEYVLKEHGLVVESAEDGSVAVHLVKENGIDYYDFILMDIQMPIMGGYDATRAIRELGYEGVIIALSANAFAEDKAASIAAGMDDHLAKPINTNELFTVLGRFAAEQDDR